jgi:uncharacterized protein with FMN-binding domain
MKRGILFTVGLVAVVAFSVPARAQQAAAKPAVVQTRAAIEATIEKAGKEPPAWLETTPLNCPATLDLTWTVPVNRAWVADKDISAYFIKQIDPNPSRHQEGCKLMHHVLTVNKDKKDARTRAMAMLGRIYGIYLHDYARGAYWYRKAIASGEIDERDAADLAYYYWKLGSREMALAQLVGVRKPGPRAVHVYGAMGEVDKALALARRLSTTLPDVYLAAGDACRYNGRYQEAAEWYRKMLEAPVDAKRPGRFPRLKACATDRMEGMQGLEKLDIKQIADGTYRGEGIGYRAPVKVDVVVKDGRIEAVKVVETREDWPLNTLQDVTARIVEKQSLQGVDAVSGATFTSDAIVTGAGKALSGAAKK